MDKHPVGWIEVCGNSCELLKKRTLTLWINTQRVGHIDGLRVVNCLKREH